jgi:hypothetical protein
MQACRESPPQYVGVYQLDVTASKLGKYDTIKDLKLTIKKDSTFEFSKDVPFIVSTRGTWEMKYVRPLDLPPSYDVRLFYSESHGSNALVPFDEGVFQFRIDYPPPKLSQQQAEVLNFKRVGEGNSVEFSPSSP